MLTIDSEASTVRIAGRYFPAAIVICPQVEGEPELSEWNRSLGEPVEHFTIHIPAENGLLFRVEEMHDNPSTAGRGNRHGLSLELTARTCNLERSDDGHLWIPHHLTWKDGHFVLNRSNFWIWAEPDWVAETIERLSVKPFTQPPGPSVRLERLSYELEKDDDE